MKYFAVEMINLYQKYISPYKGFSCAYRVGTGGLSCSAYGKLVISKYGVKKGYALLKRRFKDCTFCSQEISKRQHKKTISKLNHAQAGFGDCGGCDLPSGDCPSCDLPDCSLPDCDFDSKISKACDFFNDANDILEEIDLPERDKKKKQEENRKEKLEKKVAEHYLIK